MKKLVFVSLAGILALSFVFAAAGCGGDKNREEASKYMKQGDAAFEEARKSWDGLYAKWAGLAAGAGQAGEALLTEVETALKEMEADLDEAELAYGKIADLEGVEDYKEYASKMEEAVETMRKMVDGARGLMQEMVEAFTQSQGQGMDIVSMITGSESFQEIMRLQEELKSITGEAERLKKEKGLE